MIEAVLDALSHDLEGWHPPGTLGRGVCVACVTSPYVAIAELDRWPHEVIHPLVRRLQALAQRQSGRLRAEHEASIAAEATEEDSFFRRYEPEPYDAFVRRLETYDRHATTLVLAQVQHHRRDLDHMLWSTLGERLDSYVGRSLAVLLSQLREEAASP